MNLNSLFHEKNEGWIICVAPEGEPDFRATPLRSAAAAHHAHVESCDGGRPARAPRRGPRARARNWRTRSPPRSRPQTTRTSSPVRAPRAQSPAREWGPARRAWSSIGRGAQLGLDGNKVVLHRPDFGL